MNNRMRIQMALLSLAGIAFAGCSTSSTEPQTGSTEELFADYPVYDSATIVQESAIIVEGNVVSTEPTVSTPRYEGDSPEENPLVGLTEEEKAKAISQNGGVAGTLFHFHVNKVHKGAVNAGDEIVIVQIGGLKMMSSMLSKAQRFCRPILTICSSPQRVVMAHMQFSEARQAPIMLMMTMISWLQLRKVRHSKS